MKTLQKIALAAGLALAGRELLARVRKTDLRGQCVLITGGSRGLGLALAHEFGAHGCRIALCARDSEELARAKADLVAQDIEAETFACDVRDPSQMETLITDVTACFGQVDILVSSAGIISVGPLENMTASDFKDAMDTDFWGAVYPALAVLPQMRARQSGRIVNITSVGGKLSVPHLLPYSCAKFAATGFSEGLRAEAARDGIVVTTIVPGLLRTGSFLHAEFKGTYAGEYGWFSVGDSLPGQSLSAEAAARAIVQATRRGEAERILGLPAQAAARLNGLFPGLVSNLSGLVNRSLPPPQPGAGDTIKTGAQVRDENPSTLRDTMSGLGFAAAERLNE